jgi:hypothetical protein
MNWLTSRRPAMSASALSRSFGLLSSSAVNAAPGKRTTCDLIAALTVAVRLEPSITAISPKYEPAGRYDRNTGRPPSAFSTIIDPRRTT